MAVEYAGERSRMFKVLLLEDKGGFGRCHFTLCCAGSHWPGNSAALSCEGHKQASSSIQIQTLTLATCKTVTFVTSRVCCLLFHTGFCTEQSFDSLALGSLLVWFQLIVHPRRLVHISLLQRCL